MNIQQVKDASCQTISFELPELPGESFRLVVPEVISDSKEALLHWEQPSPEWEISSNRASCSDEVPGVVRMEAVVSFLNSKIDIIVKTTNLSNRIWEQVNLFTCFAYFKAPLFNDPDLKRTFFPVSNNTWESVGTLFEKNNPGTGAFTFFPVKGGPKLSELWICRRLKQFYPALISRGAACVESKDRKWVAGMITDNPAYLFQNRVECCIHADPLLGTIKPGECIKNKSTIYIIRGTIDDFTAIIDKQE